MLRLNSLKKYRSQRVFLSGLVIAILLIVTTARATSYREAPQLAERVAAGVLPPVEERLPLHPLVVEPHERIGDYGGDWRTALLGGGDGATLVQTIGYDYLMRWTPQWTDVIPNVAESVEVNDDATEFLFRLREGMKWSDGHPFTTNDIVFWYQGVFNNHELTPAQPEILSGLEIEAIDDYTIAFRFPEPRGLFLQHLATPDGWAYTGYPRHYGEQFHIGYNEDVDALVEEAGLEDWTELFQQHLGWGARWQNPELPTLYAWSITRPYDGSTTRVVAERNPYYFKVDSEGNQLPYLDRVVYDLFDDAEVLLLRALAGDIDMIRTHITNVANRPVLFDNQVSGGYRFFETFAPAMNTNAIALNLTHRDPVKREIFQNKDFRIGLSHAINRQEIIDLVYVGQGEPWQLAPQATTAFAHDQLATQHLEYDLDLANEYLDRAFPELDAQGYRLGPDGQRISVVVETISAIQAHIDTLELVQLHWREAGIDMQIRVIDRSLFYTNKEANEHDANVWVGGGGLDALLDPRWYFPYSMESNFAPAWAAWFMSPEQTNAEEPPAATRRQMELYRQLVTSAPETHNELMREILEIAAEEFYAIGVSSLPSGYGIARNNFRNVPAEFPSGWTYPSPAPTNPEQYFLEGGGHL